MGDINNMYDRISLSDAKKAELKAMLKKNFPQYADNISGETEVITMENKEITSSSGQARVRSRWLTGGVAAAAAIVMAAGIGFAHNAFKTSAPNSGMETENVADKDTTSAEDGSADNVGTAVVPDVAGMDITEAEQDVKLAGFINVRCVEKYDEHIYGEVLYTSFAEGEKLPKDHEIVLYYSNGDMPFSASDLDNNMIGLDVEDATALAEKFGYTVIMKRYNNSPEDIVYQANMEKTDHTVTLDAGEVVAGEEGNVSAYSTGLPENAEEGDIIRCLIDDEVNGEMTVSYGDIKRGAFTIMIGTDLNRCDGKTFTLRLISQDGSTEDFFVRDLPSYSSPKDAEFSGTEGNEINIFAGIDKDVLADVHGDTIRVVHGDDVLAERKITEEEALNGYWNIAVKGYGHKLLSVQLADDSGNVTELRTIVANFNTLNYMDINDIIA